MHPIVQLRDAAPASVVQAGAGTFNHDSVVSVFDRLFLNHLHKDAGPRAAPNTTAMYVCFAVGLALGSGIVVLGSLMRGGGKRSGATTAALPRVPLWSFTGLRRNVLEPTMVLIATLIIVALTIALLASWDRAAKKQLEEAMADQNLMAAPVGCEPGVQAALAFQVKALFRGLTSFSNGHDAARRDCVEYERTMMVNVELRVNYMRVSMHTARAAGCRMFA